MLTKTIVKKALAVYGKAWVTQDASLVLTIFTPSATYAERAFEKPHKGHKQIAAYWQSKVVEEQSSINFKLLNVYIEGNVAIAEWDATFLINKKIRKHIREVAILEFKGEKIKSLREYWHSELL